MKTKKFKLLKPRVLIPFNTGTRVILSKKDKSMTRKALNKALRNEISAIFI